MIFIFFWLASKLLPILVCVAGYRHWLAALKFRLLKFNGCNVWEKGEAGKKERERERERERNDLEEEGWKRLGALST